MNPNWTKELLLAGRTGGMSDRKAVELVRKDVKGEGQGLEEVSYQQDLSPRESWE